jgi:hypothetical protein
MRPSIRRRPSILALGGFRELVRRSKTPAARRLILSVVFSFPVGMLYGRFVLGASWGAATRPGFDAMFVTTLAASIAAVGRIAFEALLNRAERTPPE